MTAAVVARALADRRRGVLGYGFGLAVMIIWVMAIYPSVETELADYVEAMPEAMKSLFGIEEISSLAGFVHAEIFSLIGPLVVLAVAIATGASTIAGEERERILPLVLATGFGRRAVLLSKFAAMAIEVAALGAMTLAALLIGLGPAGGGISIVAATATTIQMAMLGLLFGTLALAMGAITGRKSVALGTAIGVALASYLLDALANIVSWLEPFEVLSPFHWYAPGNPLVDGASIGGLVLIAAGTAALAAAAAVAFDRRDVGV